MPRPPETLEEFLAGAMPLTEARLAGLLGLKPRSLRSERTAGRIAWKPIAGKVFYLPAAVNEWLQDGVPCRDGDRDRGSSSGGTVAASRSMLSAGTSEEANASAQRALAAARMLKTLSRTSSSPAATGKAKAAPGRVIPMKSR